MQIAIIGAGWVGVTTAVAFAKLGHQVVCSDLNAARITRLQAGEMPFFETGLPELLTAGLANGSLQFTTDNATAMREAVVVFCCVDTPTDTAGKTDLRAVMAVAHDFARYAKDGAVYVVKSTVPAGTGAQVRAAIQSALDENGRSIIFAVAANPEFLAESTALRDTLEPSRIVIGSDDAWAGEAVAKVYAPISANGARVVLTTCATAEVIKCASNSYLATRISFMNEIANYASAVGADPMAVAEGMGLDPRIGNVRPGVGYGGGCFPKDIRALLGAAEAAGQPLRVLQATHDVNVRQRVRLYESMLAITGPVAGKIIAIWGVAFKPNTDDIREAPALYFIERLLKEGAQVRVYDPRVRESIKQLFSGIELAASALGALDGAEALVVMTEWAEFKGIELSDMMARMSDNILVDGRFIWSKSQAETQGFRYCG